MRFYGNIWLSKDTNISSFWVPYRIPLWIFKKTPKNFETSRWEFCKELKRHFVNTYKHISTLVTPWFKKNSLQTSISYCIQTFVTNEGVGDVQKYLPVILRNMILLIHLTNRIHSIVSDLCLDTPNLGLVVFYTLIIKGAKHS